MESLSGLSVQAPRDVARGVLQHRRRKCLGDVDMEENLHRRRQQDTAHRTAGKQPAEGPVQPLPAPHSPSGDRRRRSPVYAPPPVAALASLPCHDGGREILGHRHTLIHHQLHAGWATARANPIAGLCWLRHRPYRLLQPILQKYLIEFRPPRSPNLYERRPHRYACGSTNGPIGIPRVHKKIVLRSGKAHKSPTLRVAASRAIARSPSNRRCSRLMGPAAFAVPRT